MKQEKGSDSYSLLIYSHQTVLFNTVAGQDLSVGLIVTESWSKPSRSRAGLAEVAWTFRLPGRCKAGNRIGAKIIRAIASSQRLVLLAFHVCLSW